MATVLVTGAGRGFGRALFDVYSHWGWTTFPLVREASVAAELQSIGGSKCHPIVADVMTENVEREISSTVVQHTGTLDVLINNAGTIRKHRGLDSTTVDDLQELFCVHCVGVLRCVKSSIPFLRKSERAVIVNISSRWGSISRTVPGLGGSIYSYQIAKCAQNMLTVCLDQELRKEGIRVLAVHPGRLKTEVAAPDANTDLEEAARVLADWIEHADERTPSGFYDVMGRKYIEW